MIVSHKHQYIFIKTRKVGGTTMEMALRADLGEDDIVTPNDEADESLARHLGVSCPQNTEILLNKYKILDLSRLIIKRRKARFFHHMPAPQLFKYLSSDTYERYFKFSVVRNPYDYVLSLYLWHRRCKNTNKSLIRWVEEDFGLNIPTNWSVITFNDRLCVDKVLFYESLSNDFYSVCQKIGLSDSVYKTFSRIHAKDNSAFQKENSNIEPPVINQYLRITAKKCYPEFHEFGYGYVNSRLSKRGDVHDT